MAKPFQVGLVKPLTYPKVELYRYSSRVMSFCTSYRRFYLRPHRIAQTMTRKDFWLNWRRTFKVAFKTIFPKKEKNDLRDTVEASV